MKFTYTLLTLVLYCFTLSAQSSFKISGFVMNEDRMPVEAVSISVVGNNNTIQSDQNGFFELTLAASGTIILHIDALGYFPQSTQLSVSNNIHRDFILRKNNIELEEVVVSGNNKRSLQMKSAQNLVQVDKSYIEDNFSGSLMQSLEKIPGVRAMTIGSGQSKPAIRGLGFNRMMVTENGIKHEGQQYR